MSVSIGVIVTLATLFIPIGVDTERPMCLDICTDQKIYRPTRVVLPPEQSWTEKWGNRQVCPIGYNDNGRWSCIPRAYIGEELVLSPRWVPSGEPTSKVYRGNWMKLQL